MNDQTRMVAGAALGAIVGGLAVYVTFTPRGRRMLTSLNPALDELSDALQELRVALRKAEGVAHDAKGAFDDVRTVLTGDHLQS